MKIILTTYVLLCSGSLYKMFFYLFKIEVCINPVLNINFSTNNKWNR